MEKSASTAALRMAGRGVKAERFQEAMPVLYSLATQSPRSHGDLPPARGISP
jgi:hypothetical protein